MEMQKKLVKDLSQQSKKFKNELKDYMLKKIEYQKPKNQTLNLKKIIKIPQMKQGKCFRHFLLDKEQKMLEDFYANHEHKIQEAFLVISQKFKNHSIFKNENHLTQISSLEQIKKNPVVLRKSKTNKLISKQLIDINFIWRLFVKFSNSLIKFQDFKLSMYNLNKNLEFTYNDIKEIVFQLFFLKDNNQEMIIVDQDLRDFMNAINEFLPNQQPMTIIDKDQLDIFKERNEILTEQPTKVWTWSKIKRKEEYFKQIILECIKDYIDEEIQFQEKLEITYKMKKYIPDENLTHFEKLYEDRKVQQDHLKQLLKQQEQELQNLQKKSFANNYKGNLNQLKLYQNVEKEKMLKQKEKSLQDEKIRKQELIKSQKVTQMKEEELKKVKEELIGLSKEKDELMKKIQANDEQRGQLEKAKQETIDMNKKMKKLIKMMNQQKNEMESQKEEIQKLSKKQIQEKDLEIQRYKTQNLQFKVESQKIDYLQKQLEEMKETNLKLQEKIKKNTNDKHEIPEKTKVNKQKEKTFLKTQKEEPILDQEERVFIYLFYHPKIKQFFMTNFLYFERIYNNLKKSQFTMKTSFVRDEVPYLMDQEEFCKIIHFFNFFQNQKEVSERVKEYGVYSKVKQQHYHLIDVFRFVIMQFFYGSSKNQDDQNLFQSFNELCFFDSFLEYFQFLEKNLIINNYFSVQIRSDYQCDPNMALNEQFYEKIIHESKTGDLLRHTIYDGSSLQDNFKRMENIQTFKKQMIEGNPELEEQIDKTIIAMSIYFFLKRSPHPSQVSEKINLNNIINTNVKQLQSNDPQGDFFLMVEIQNIDSTTDNIESQILKTKMMTEQLEEYEEKQKLAFQLILNTINQIVIKKTLNEDIYKEYQENMMKILN